MIHYTGDIHGDIKPILAFIEKHSLTQDDTIVILGDAGLNYYLDFSEAEKKKRLNKTGVTIFCIHGNHEERPENIPSYERKRWNGGTVFYENEFPNLLFAKDGEIYNLDGKETIVIGGAYSVDKYYRLMSGYKWFKDEQPSEETKQHIEDVLESRNWTIDQVLSHTCPASYIPVEAFLPNIDQRKVDRSTEDWLDTIEKKLSYDRWLCGHWHIDKSVNKLRFLNKDVTGG